MPIYGNGSADNGSKAPTDIDRMMIYGNGMADNRSRMPFYGNELADNITKSAARSAKGRRPEMV